MASDIELINTFMQYGFAGLVLYITVKKIDELKETIRDMQNTLKELIFKISAR